MSIFVYNPPRNVSLGCRTSPGTPRDQDLSWCVVFAEDGPVPCVPSLHLSDWVRTRRSRGVPGGRVSGSLRVDILLSVGFYYRQGRRPSPLSPCRAESDPRVRFLLVSLFFNNWSCVPLWGRLASHLSGGRAGGPDRVYTKVGAYRSRTRPPQHPSPS